MQVILLRKISGGPPARIDAREWTSDMMASLQHANFLLLNGREYEMLEGRLDVTTGSLELLVEEVEAERRTWNGGAGHER